MILEPAKQLAIKSNHSSLCLEGPKPKKTHPAAGSEAEHLWTVKTWQRCRGAQSCRADLTNEGRRHTAVTVPPPKSASCLNQKRFSYRAPEAAALGEACCPQRLLAKYETLLEMEEKLGYAHHTPGPCCTVILRAGLFIVLCRQSCPRSSVSPVHHLGGPAQVLTSEKWP